MRDEEAFLSLFKCYAPLIRPFARKITQSDADAEDIIQETFIRIWLYRDKLPDIQHLRKWIYTVAARECMRYMRQRLSHEKKTKAFENRQELPENTCPFRFVQYNEIHKIVNRVVDAMPSQRKRIYQLSRDQGLKPAAIAAELSLSVGTVKNVLSRALNDIRYELIKAGISISLLFFLLR